jgi:dTDP-4-dehydrorhamnose 3,5-epimerase
MKRESGLLDGATRDRQSVTSEWKPVGRDLIAGIRVVEITAVAKRAGVLTEVFRRDWLDAPDVAQVFQVLLNPAAISAWHVHLETTDRLFVAAGSVTLALYDARDDSPTAGLVNEMHLTIARPQLVVVPPGIWHGLISTGAVPALILNLPDRAYAYENPDHWRLPPVTPEIPYRFGGRPDALG